MLDLRKFPCLWVRCIGSRNRYEEQGLHLTSMSASSLLAIFAICLSSASAADTAVGDVAVNPRWPHPYEKNTEGNIDRFGRVLESAATGGTAFSMHKLRSYEGPSIDFDATATPAPRFMRPAEAEMCSRWAVMTSVVNPTETVKQLSELRDWCIVVVGDLDGKFFTKRCSVWVGILHIRHSTVVLLF